MIRVTLGGEKSGLTKFGIYVGTHLGVHSLPHMYQTSKSAYHYNSTNYPFALNVQLFFLLLRLFANMQLCDKMRK